MLVNIKTNKLSVSLYHWEKEIAFLNVVLQVCVFLSSCIEIVIMYTYLVVSVYLVYELMKNKTACVLSIIMLQRKQTSNTSLSYLIVYIVYIPLILHSIGHKCLLSICNMYVCDLSYERNLISLNFGETLHRRLESVRS